MFKVKSFIRNEFVDIGVSMDTNNWLFGLDISLNLPETLILIGVGPFNFYITMEGKND